jgi:hypothetical protein
MSKECQRSVNDCKKSEICVLFTVTMNHHIKYFFSLFIILVFTIGISSCSREGNQEFSELAKVSLRDAGDRLLLAGQNSTSLVKPVMALEEFKYQLSFERELAINPDSLIAIVKNSLLKANLPQDYLTEVIQCADGEVGYSYEMKGNEQRGIIPCRGRILPEACYTITIRFTKPPKSASANSVLLYLSVLVVLGIVGFVYYRRKLRKPPEALDEKFASIGRFKFYPEQNKLIKEATEISLSKIECELLAIFVANPNKVIKRDELTKKVWEDKGVVVGRSLDTYISKLRKKLQDDSSVKLTNVHGVGYKLEINH